MKTVTLCLGFDRHAGEAVRTYVDLFNEVFGNSEIVATTYWGQKEIDMLKSLPDLPEEQILDSAETEKSIRFTLNGQEIVVFNGGPYFGRFNESTSLYVSCETQDQIDRLWATLSENGEEQACGWVKDQYGVSWQIVPSLLWEVVEGPDREKEDRMNAALYAMTKIDLEGLERAAGL